MRFVGGRDGQVFVIGADGEPRKLGDFEWGLKLPSPKCYALSKAILTACKLPGHRVLKLYMRFMYRMGLTKGEPWTRVTDDWMQLVTEIEEAEKEMAQERQRMARELPKGAAGGGGIGEWGGTTHAQSKEAPVLVPNDPKKARAR